MRNLEQIKSKIVSDILDINDSIRLVEGDTQYDVIVSATASQFYKYEVLLELEDRTRTLSGYQDIINDESFKTTVADILGFKEDGTAYTVDDVNDLISDRLTAYVSNWGVSRGTGSSASGTVRLFLSNQDTVSWDNSTKFTSKSGQEYTPTSSSSDITPVFDTSTGLYYVDISVESDSTSLEANATVGSITTMDPKPTNFSYVTNPSALNGGSDSELDLDLINRSETIWASRVNGSTQAFERIAEAEDYVEDVIALNEDDPDNEIYLGSVCDVFTQFSSDDTELVEEIFYWPGESENADEEQFEFTPTNQPLCSTPTPTVFIYTTAGVESQVVPDGTDTIVSVVTDTNTFSGSAKANNKISIKMALNTTNYQRKIKILYTYDKNPYKLQSVFDDSEERMIGPSPLVRKATDVPVRVIIEPQIAFGYVESDVQSTITDNITAFFSGGTTSFGRQYARKEIGKNINHSDIADIVLRTEGVVSYDTDTFFVVNTLTGSLNDPIEIKNNEYTTLNDVLFSYSSTSLSNFTASSGGV
jgi:hypothetical protein